MKKEDFVKFYFENRDRKGYLSLKDLKQQFDFSREETLYSNFTDKNGLNFLKYIHLKEEMDSEIIMSRIYDKHGFISAKYFPVINHNSGATSVASPNIFTNDSAYVDDFDERISNYGSNIVNRFYMPTLTEDDLTGFYTKGAIRQLLLMRLLDVASFNTDRHIDNYFYHIKEDNGIQIVDGIKTFDYGESGILYNHKTNNVKYYNNTNFNGEEIANSTRKDLIDDYKNDEAVQLFLPKQESSEVLGNVDFNQEGKNIKDEIGYSVNPKLLDVWQKSFDDMANELAK